MIFQIMLVACFAIHNSVSIETPNCSINCFFTTSEKEFIKCNEKIYNDSYSKIDVTCGKSDEITIGNLESVRSLSTNFLEDMSLVQYLTINLHMMTLDSDVLSSDHLTELNLIYIEKINQNSFINLPNLENINFGRITSKQLPEFFILRHRKKKQITTVNIEVNCYRCQENSKDLLVFPILSKKIDVDLYMLQSINSDSCPIKSDLKYCNSSIKVNRKRNETITYRSLRLDQKQEIKNNEIQSSISIPLALFYIGLIIFLAMTVLILCLLLLQLWTICQLKKATKILKGLQFFPTMNESEISDNNETNSYFGNNGILYQHNFSRPKM